MEPPNLSRTALFMALALSGCASIEGSYFYDVRIDTIDTYTYDTGADTGWDTAHLDTAVDDVPPVDTIPYDTAVDDGVADTIEEEDRDGVDPLCATDLGTFTPGETASMLDTSHGEYWDVLGSVTTTLSSSPCSMVVIQSNITMGGPTSPGTYTVTSYVSPTSCAACIFVMEGCDMTTGTCTHMYMADSATLELTTIDSREDGLISGRLHDVHMIEVEQMSGTVVPGGLTLCLDEWSFSDSFMAF